MPAWLGTIGTKLIQWIIANAWSWFLDHAWALWLRYQQDLKDKKNAEEFKEELGPNKDRDERSRRGEDILNGN